MTFESVDAEDNSVALERSCVAALRELRVLRQICADAGLKTNELHKTTTGASSSANSKTGGAASKNKKSGTSTSAEEKSSFITTADSSSTTTFTPLCLESFEKQILANRRERANQREELSVAKALLLLQNVKVPGAPKVGQHGLFSAKNASSVLSSSGGDTATLKKTSSISSTTGGGVAGGLLPGGTTDSSDGELQFSRSHRLTCLEMLQKVKLLRQQYALLRSDVLYMNHEMNLSRQWIVKNLNAAGAC
ncbi:unnamed protein product [Amoebophrya sp. A25]|nr:unnamed protein product [Amoebophrya sp. A25]|eukprot:GSA25T00008404001.1